MGRPPTTRGAKLLARELRFAMSWSEARLWTVLQRRQLGIRFRRQVPIGWYVADFACLDPKLVIEVDGDSHIYQDESRRTSYLESKGFRVVRVTNEEVQKDLDGVRSFLEDVIRELRDRPT